MFSTSSLLTSSPFLCLFLQIHFLLPLLSVLFRFLGGIFFVFFITLHFIAALYPRLLFFFQLFAHLSLGRRHHFFLQPVLIYSIFLLLLFSFINIFPIPLISYISIPTYHHQTDDTRHILRFQNLTATLNRKKKESMLSSGTNQ